MTDPLLRSDRPWLLRLNGGLHQKSLWIYTAIVLAHWGEHLLQAWQIYYLRWPRPEALGMLGYFYPWLVESELLHYAYALVMLAAFWILRPGFAGRGRLWWSVALWIQFWHHFEHALLQGQAIAGWNFLGSPVPVSVLQIWVPRAELHIFYNTVVFVPMLIAMWHHVFPAAEEAASHRCTCSLVPRAA